MRDSALQLLLDLTTNTGMFFFLLKQRFTTLNAIMRVDRKTRLLAINSAKRWVPGSLGMSATIQKYAVQMARRLVVADVRPKEEAGEDMEEGEEAEENVLSTYATSNLTSPVPADVVRQHIELYLGLSHRDPDMLEE